MQTAEVTEGWTSCQVHALLDSNIAMCHLFGGRSQVWLSQSTPMAATHMTALQLTDAWEHSKVCLQRQNYLFVPDLASALL